MQAFKEQTKQYKQVYEAAKVMGQALGAQFFDRLECIYVALLTVHIALQNVAVPLNGDVNAVKKYADEMEKIKKQVRCIAYCNWVALQHHLML